MFKTILLCTDGSPGANVAAQYAIWLAQRLASRILALHVTDIRILEGPLLADISGALGAQPYSALLSQVKRIQGDRASIILENIAKQCREGGVDCEVAYETGGLVQTMLDYEARATLVVLGQRGEHAPFHPDLPGSSVERMVRASKQPCLVTTDTFRPVQRILLAHDGSLESTKALHRGLNLAVACKAQVTLVTACTTEHENDAAKILQQAGELARARELPAQTQLVHENPETAILKVADEAKADLIVMGAYGHTRIREWILGSTTSQVLRKTTVPVLLARGE